MPPPQNRANRATTIITRMSSRVTGSPRGHGSGSRYPAESGRGCQHSTGGSPRGSKERRGVTTETRRTHRKAKARNESPRAPAGFRWGRRLGNPLPHTVGERGRAADVTPDSAGQKDGFPSQSL